MGPSRTTLCSLGWSSLLAAVVFGVGAACGGSGPDKTVELKPGETVEGPHGVNLRADSAALEKPVEVTVERTDAPTGETPFEEGVSGTGTTFRITASRDVWASGKGSFHISLPRPDAGGDGKLAAAVHTQSDEYFALTQSEEFERSPVWSYVPSTVSENKLGFAISKLDAGDGRVVSAVRGRDFAPKEVSEPQTARQALPHRTAEQASHEQQNGFRARCYGFWRTSRSCKSRWENEAAEVLARSYHKLQGKLDFREPELANKGGLGKYLIRLRPCEIAELSKGFYNPVTNVSWTCIEEDADAALPQDTVEGIRHEFTHATQAAYGSILTFKWPLLDGSASLMERSLDAGLSLKLSFGKKGRRVDQQLIEQEGIDEQTNKFRFYQVQYFWGFLGNYLGKSDPSYVKKLYRPGFATDLGKVFEEQFDDVTLSEVYWEWVKNRAIEGQYKLPMPNDKDNFPAKVPSKDCVFNSSSVDDDPKEISFAKGAGLSEASVGPLEYLQAEVVEITLKPSSNAYQVTLGPRNQIGEGYPYVKFYRNHNNPTDECFEPKERPELETIVPPNSSKTVYAVVANPLSNAPPNAGDNASRFEELPAQLEATAQNHQLEVDITKPADTSTHREGNRIQFEADVQASADVEKIVWKTDSPDNTGSDEAMFGRGEEPSTYDLCPEGHKITAKVTDAFGRTATDQISVTIENRKPSVSFKQQPPSTVPSGGFLLAQVGVSDPQCSGMADPEETEWFIDGDWAGRGAVFDYPVRASAGEEFDVKARYEDLGSPRKADETKTVTVSVTSPNSEKKPSVIIESPDPGESVSDPKILLKATVRDGDEPNDTLTGSSVEWTITDQQGHTFKTTGKENRVNPKESNAAFEYGQMTVHFEATDPDGNTDSDSHQFFFDPEG